MLTNDDIKHWGPNPAMREKVARGIAEGARVLEIGPGSVPFSRATYFVDWRAGENTVTCDLSHDRLPFGDKVFDFVYCRHVLEDLYNPVLICEEMSRVGKAGYVETPSPLAEVCRGVDGNSPPCRGYHHHRYVAWAEDGILFFLAKYPYIEYLTFNNEAAIADALRESPFVWNTYYFWSNRINWRMLQHDADYTIAKDYRDILTKAISAGICNANEAMFDVAAH